MLYGGMTKLWGTMIGLSGGKKKDQCDLSLIRNYLVQPDLVLCGDDEIDDIQANLTRLFLLIMNHKEARISLVEHDLC